MGLNNIREKKSHEIRIIVAAAGIAVFFAILFTVVTGRSQNFDDSARFFFYDMRSEWLTWAAKIITYMGNWHSIVILCIIFLIIKPLRMTYGVPVSLGAVFVTLMNKVIKTAVQRPRPDEIFRLIDEGGFSFSSGHSITSMFVFGMLIYLVRNNVKKRMTANILTVILLIPTIFIGLSRIYLGVHYPTDVLAGWCMGIAVIMFAIEIIERITGKNKKI